MKIFSTDFYAVYETHHQKVARLVAGLPGEEAGDLIQAIWIRIYLGLPSFRGTGPSDLSLWVQRLVKNMQVDRVRQINARNKQREKGYREMALNPALDPHPLCPERGLERQEMHDCLRQFIARLPGDYRAVLRLNYAEGLSNAEIADALGISLALVKIRLHRARVRLGQQLAADCTLYRDGRNELACMRREEDAEGRVTARIP